MSLLIIMMATALAGQLAHQMINFGFCADVDTLRRLVENDRSRAPRQPFSKHDFLLVSAAQVRDGRLQRAGLDVSSLAIASTTLCFCVLLINAELAYWTSAGSVTFSRTPIAVIRPRRRRSSGTGRCHFQSASRGESIATARHRADTPDRRRSTPQIASASSIARLRSGRRCPGSRHADRQ